MGLLHNCLGQEYLVPTYKVKQGDNQQKKNLG